MIDVPDGTVAFGVRQAPLTVASLDGVGRVPDTTLPHGAMMVGVERFANR